MTAQDLGPALSPADMCPEDLDALQRAAFARDIERIHARAAEFVAVACPACGTDRPQPAFEKFGFRFNHCPACRTLYMSPRPSEAVMAMYYATSENYALWAEHIFPRTEASRREKIHKPWLARIADYCQRHGIARGRLVEVGPGFGTFSSLAAQSGLFEDVIAIEPTPGLAAACRARGVKVIEKRVEDVPAGTLNADIVVSFEVIEHLFAPAGFIRQMAALLRPGGLLILSCPNGLGFDVAMRGAGSDAVDAEHVNLFNPDALAGLLARSGFSVLEATTPGRLDAELVRNAALAGELTLDPFLQRVLIDEWDSQGAPFQAYLAAQGLSAHMWIAARRD